MKTSRLLLIALLANNITTFSMEEDQNLGSDTGSGAFSESSSEKTDLSGFRKQLENLKVNEQQTTWGILSNHYKLCKQFENNSDETAIIPEAIINLWTKCAQQDLNTDDSHPGKQLLVEHGVEMAPRIEGAPEKINSLSHPSILRLFGEKYHQYVTTISDAITKADEDQEETNPNKEIALTLLTFRLIKAFAKKQYAVQKPLYAAAKNTDLVQLLRKSEFLRKTAGLPFPRGMMGGHNRPDECATQ